MLCFFLFRVGFQMKEASVEKLKKTYSMFIFNLQSHTANGVG